MSEPNYTNDGIYIVKALLQHLNSWSGKPCKINLEAFDKNATSMMMQQLSGAVKKREYVNGAYIGALPFAVYIRVTGADTANKLDATETLNNLADWLETAPVPHLGGNRRVIKIEMTALPSLFERLQDGTEDYQAIFNLDYKQGGQCHA